MRANIFSYFSELSPIFFIFSSRTGISEQSSKVQPSTDMFSPTQPSAAADSGNFAEAYIAGAPSSRRQWLQFLNEQPSIFISRGAGPSIHFEKSHLMYIAGSAVSVKKHPFTSAPSVSKNSPRPLFEPNLQSTMSTLGKAVAFDTGIPAFAYSGSGFSHVQGLHSRLAEFLSGGCEHGPCAE